MLIKRKTFILDLENMPERNLTTKKNVVKNENQSIINSIT